MSIDAALQIDGCEASTSGLASELGWFKQNTTLRPTPSKITNWPRASFEEKQISHGVRDRPKRTVVERIGRGYAPRKRGPLPGGDKLER